jgi:hypothetical protein
MAADALDEGQSAQHRHPAPGDLEAAPERTLIWLPYQRRAAWPAESRSLAWRPADRLALWPAEARAVAAEGELAATKKALFEARSEGGELRRMLAAWEAMRLERGGVPGVL